MFEKKILLIGNGPSATSMKLGVEIDDFPLVARFNAYQINEFEEYVGTKTDYWITCSSHPGWWKDYKKVFLCSYHRTQDNKILAALRKRYPDCDHFPEWVWVEVFGDMKFMAPSSGAVAATYFSRDYEVFIYGFDFFMGKEHHYGDNIPLGPNHNPEWELRYFQKLFADKGVVPFHNYLDSLERDNHAHDEV